MIKKNWGYLFLLTAGFLQACSSARPITSSPAKDLSPTPVRNVHSSSSAKDPLQSFTEEELLQQPGLQSAQVGISLYDPATATYKYNYEGNKYFIPASNTKLFSLYAGLKYLGDSLVGMRYKITDTAVLVIPTGDPTFLHPAYTVQPVIDLLKRTGKKIWLADDNWQENAQGRGWAWDDYNDDYAAERSPFPIYGNMIRWVQEKQAGNENGPLGSSSPSIYSIPEVDWSVKFTTDTTQKAFFVHRRFHENLYEVTEGKEVFKQQYTPFITDGLASAALLLKDTTGRPAGVNHLKLFPVPGVLMIDGTLLTRDEVKSDSLRKVLAAQYNFWELIDGSHTGGWNLLHSRPVDSLFCPMMHNSDNFFAEQTLLMVSNQRLGVMKDAKIIDYLLNNDLKDLPQRPSWVDGCGLSRNDLFSPQDFIWVLDKMQKEFGLARMKNILPTGGTGTLASYYHSDSTFIYAKTGSLSGVVALSGYLLTKKDHLLLFSILINNYTGSGVTVRRQMEKWIHKVRDTY